MLTRCPQAYGTCPPSSSTRPSLSSFVVHPNEPTGIAHLPDRDRNGRAGVPILIDRRLGRVPGELQQQHHTTDTDWGDNARSAVWSSLTHCDATPAWLARG